MAKAKQLPSGAWRVLLYVGTDPNGKRRYESFTAPTKAEAELLASRRKVEIEHGVTVERAPFKKGRISGFFYTILFSIFAFIFSLKGNSFKIIN